MWHLCLYMQVYLDFINTCFFGNLPPLPPPFQTHFQGGVWGGSAFNPLLLFCAVFQSRCNPGKIVCDQQVEFFGINCCCYCCHFKQQLLFVVALNCNCSFCCCYCCFKKQLLFVTAAVAAAINYNCYLLLLFQLQLLLQFSCCCNVAYQQTVDTKLMLQFIKANVIFT